MVSHYSVIQYVPDPVTDERINIGVIATGDGHIHSRFLSDWRRVRHFGHQDITFLKDFAARVRDASETQLSLDVITSDQLINPETLSRMAGTWVNSVQITPPKASLLPPGDVLVEMAERFLRWSNQTKRGFRDRRAAVGLATRQLEGALVDRIGKDARNYLKRNIKVPGRLDTHKFDVGVINGGTYVAAQGLSFEVPESEGLLKDVDAFAWAVDDVRHQQPELPLAIVTLRPPAKSKTFERAKHIFEGLKASFVQEETLHEWAETIAARVKPL